MRTASYGKAKEKSGTLRCADLFITHFIESGFCFSFYGRASKLIEEPPFQSAVPLLTT